MCLRNLKVIGSRGGPRERPQELRVKRMGFCGRSPKREEEEEGIGIQKGNNNKALSP